VLNVVFCL
jgi:hypothetical protein